MNYPKTTDLAYMVVNNPAYLVERMGVKIGKRDVELNMTVTDKLDDSIVVSGDSIWVYNLRQFTDTLTMPVWKFIWRRVFK